MMSLETDTRLMLKSKMFVLLQKRFGENAALADFIMLNELNLFIVHFEHFNN